MAVRIPVITSYSIHYTKLYDLLTQQGRRRHLAARHAVDCVVDEDCSDLLSAHRGMDDLRRSDGDKVAVTLIGEYREVGMHALDAGCDRGRA